MLAAAEHPPTKEVLKRQAAQGRDGLHHSAQFGKALHATDDRIAGMRGSADIIEKLVAMIGTHRDAPMHVASILPTLLLLQQHCHQGIVKLTS